MIEIRSPATIHEEEIRIENGTCRGRWHFSFGGYRDPKNMGWGDLRVFNDDTLSPGAVWPLHPHREIEVVTYCAAGEFRHADEHGVGDVLKKGWVQHTTVGRGMMHSEINDRKDAPMRFIQIWIRPERGGLEPSVEQRAVEPDERTNRWLPLVSNIDVDALPIRQDARVLAARLEADRKLTHGFAQGKGGYLLILEGGPIEIGGRRIQAEGAAKIRDEPRLEIKAVDAAELLLVEVSMRRTGSG
jgi:redox-sensitive bicupin YhaK (pirin superfamily)